MSSWFSSPNIALTGLFLQGVGDENGDVAAGATSVVGRL